MFFLVGNFVPRVVVAPRISPSYTHLSPTHKLTVSIVTALENSLTTERRTTSQSNP